MKEYKFRSECLIDVQDVAKALLINGVNHSILIENNDLDGMKIPDCDCEIYTNESIEKIRQIMSIDCEWHVMAQTLDHSRSYTGRRFMDY